MVRPVKGLSGSIATGDSTHFGTNDLDQVNLLLTGTNQHPDDVTTTTPWTATNFSLDAGFNTAKQFAAFDAYVYIDTNDSNKIKGRMNRTGTVYSDPTNADVVLNAVINDLTGTSAQTITSGANLYLWTGGFYGTIGIGPGTFNIANSVILQSNIALIGSGPWATKLKLVASHADNSTSHVLKSSMWDTYYNSSPSAVDAQKGDKGIKIMHLTIDGNQINNGTITTTAPTSVSAGVESAQAFWGAGIAMYGVGLFIDDVWVIFCRGPGIVCQCAGQNLGGTTGTSPTAVQNTGDTWGARINNVRVHNNNQQGILVRCSLSYISNVSTGGNGEAGIDYQSNGYFSGSAGWLSRGILFLDGQNHSAEPAGTYNPQCVELRITGAKLSISDLWVEAPNGPGDCLALGIDGQPLFTSTTAALSGGAGWTYANNIMIDNARYACLRLTKYAYRNKLTNIHIQPNVEVAWGGLTYPTQAALYQNAVICNGQFGNWIEVNVRDLPSPAETTNHHAALVVGDATHIATGNHVKLNAMACQYDLRWGNASNNENTIEIVHHYATDYAGSVALIDTGTGSAAIDYTKNNIKVLAIGDTAAHNVGFMDSNGGLQSITTDGSTKTFSWNHGLYATPQAVSVIPQTADSVGNFYITVSGTQITVTYPVAPPAGSNALWWNARVNPQ